MLDINTITLEAPPAPEPEPLAKAHPAASLIKTPGWTCSSCNTKNPITAAFCQKCQE